MRVLIILALVGAAFSELIATSPLGLSSFIVDSTKPRYEYSSSVQTPTYNNFAYVRSGEDIARTVVSAPLVAAVEPKPTIIAARSDYPYFASPYYASNFLNAPFVRTAAIPTSNIVLKSDFSPWSTTRLLPVGERVLVKTAEPAVVPAAIAATPANIVQTVVEPKIVGAGILERKSQYHSQNLLGEATYGHTEPFQSHDAVQDAFGNKVGSFKYISADGRLLQTDYVADANGYRVKSNALPVAPTEIHTRRRREAPAKTEEVKEKVEETVALTGLVPDAAVAEGADKKVEKRSLSLIAPHLFAPSVLRTYPVPVARTWVAPNIVHAPLAYTSYAAAPWSAYNYNYNAPLYRSSLLW